MATRRIMSREDVIQELRFPTILDNAIRAGWIKPIGSTGGERAGKWLFDGRHVDAMIDRILGGEMPPILTRQPKETP